MSVADSSKGALAHWQITAPIATMHLAQRLLKPHWIGGNIYALSAADVVFILQPKLGASQSSKSWAWGLKIGVAILTVTVMLATLSITVFWYFMLASFLVVFGHSLRR